jgi:hypothetical protein
MILLSGLFFLGITAIESKLYTEDVSTQKRLWEQYKQDHNREYRLLEENGRFKNFVKNLKRADELQSQEIMTGESGNFGITRFFDLSEVRSLSVCLSIDCRLLDLLICTLLFL